MKFTLKVTQPNQPSKYLPNCIVVNGAVCMVKSVGKGKMHEEGGIGPGGDGDTWEVYERYEDELVPLWDSEAMKAHGLTREGVNGMSAKEAAQKHPDCLIKMGVQNGYVAENYEEAKEAEKTAKLEAFDKSTPIHVVDGLGFFRIETQLPKNVWPIVAKTAKYCYATDDDMDWYDDQYPGCRKSDIRGWHHSTGSIDALLAAGYTVVYRGKKLESVAQINEVDKELAQKQKEHEAKIKEVHLYVADWNAKMTARKELATPEQVAMVKTCKEIHLFNHTGENIYGGGSWLAIHGNDLFYVKNNGMDGDNWALNNYDTGGAGAICFFIKDGAELIAEAEQFISQIGEYAAYTND